MKHWHTRRIREAIEIHRHNTMPQDSGLYINDIWKPLINKYPVTPPPPPPPPPPSPPPQTPYINHHHPPNPQSSRQPHSYNAQQTTADYNAAYVGDTQSISSTAHTTHGFETPRRPQPGDSSPDGQPDGPADHPCPLPDDSSPHGHVFFPPTSAPR
ncbi:protein enabled homolog [Strongylocentrotus purpuratus]|uniref:Uncharacterized protein n=1 Tax=Strongylocentrotus purpuratus TaxID=7668 RepID=A0A7M7PC30_STRPU|nr:protein enabled homolog [Strongylocentrotus purpuratus]